jgi:hypothetical protein
MTDNGDEVSCPRVDAIEAEAMINIAENVFMSASLTV